MAVAAFGDEVTKARHPMYTPMVRKRREGAVALATASFLFITGCAAPKRIDPLLSAEPRSLPLEGRVLQDAFQAIGNERPVDYDQFDRPERRPLQRFPRLTFPALVEPRVQGGTQMWYVPLIFDRGEIGEDIRDWVAFRERFTLHLSRRDEPGLPPNFWDVTDFLTDQTVLTQGRDLRDRLLPGDRRSEPSKSGSFGIVLAIPVERKTREQGTVVPAISAISNADPFAEEWLDGANWADLYGGFQSEETNENAGFYHLHVLPKLADLPPAIDICGMCDRSMSSSWLDMEEQIEDLVPVDQKLGDDEISRARACLCELRRRIDSFRLPHFDDDLSQFETRIDGLIATLRAQPRKVHVARKHAISALRNVLDQRDTVAPVFLAASGTGDFAFAIAGDLQYHANMDAMKRFLAKLEQPQTWCDPSPSEEHGDGNGVPCSVASNLDFIIIDGDLADSEAGSARLKLALNVLQILPPNSPYNTSGGNEFVDIRAAILAARRPIFAVPGNHDGYVGYGGILNTFVDELGSAIVDPTWRSIARLFGARQSDPHFGRLNHYIPTFVQWNLINRKPRYDGLGEWQTFLGPLNVAFRYHGYGFLGLNSYDLTAKERGAIGGAVFNWGGGLQDSSVDWFAERLQDFHDAGLRRQFVFMHHDPRGAVPTSARYEERNFGIYDPTDTGASLLTLGFLGIGNSPKTGIRLPLVTPGVTYLSRLFDASVNPVGEGSQQEWMRKRVWFWGAHDDRAYNARSLVGAISKFVTPPRDGLPCRNGSASSPPTSAASAGTPNSRDGFISHVFFAHDNVPIPSGGRIDSRPLTWGDETQDGFVFREDPTHPWSDNEWIGVKGSHCWSPANWLACQRPLSMWAFKYRNWEPPAWAREETVKGNASVVRLDDLGDSTSKSYGYGFHVVHVHTSTDCDGDCVDIYWVPL